MRLRWTTFPVVAIATLALTAATAFGATIMVDSDGLASPNNCAGTQTVPKTIDGGIAAAQPGDTVKVCGEAAPYGAATVNKSVKLVGVGNPVVNSSGGTGLTLSADNASVRGFEITGNATGIATSASNSGYSIANNNIHNNGNGIDLNSNGAKVTTVSGNTISDNSNAGITSTTLSNANIKNNTFANNAVFGIILSPSTTDTGIGILSNSFSGGGHSDIVFNGTVNNSRVVGNQITDPGITAGNSQAAAIFVGGASVGDKVTNNQITSANNFGIWVSSTAAGAVKVNGNKVTNSKSTGIQFDGTTHGNTISRNHSTGSAGVNCNDSSTGTGTAGTANIWTANTAAPSTPVGICS